MRAALHLERTIVAGLSAIFVVGACASSTPPPSPERSPSPTIPSCITDADCVGGEECAEGVCIRPGLDGSAEACVRGCPPGTMCVDGDCVELAKPDGGSTDACGGCPETTTCNPETHRCEADRPLPDPGRREIPDPNLRLRANR